MATITKPNPAHRGDPLFLPDLLRAFGVRVEEFTGWRDRGHGDFYGIWGVVAHHTGDNNTSTSLIAYGHSALKGLLSQIHLARNGLATITGAGVAWHAGMGSYPGIQTNAANQVTIGVEAVSDGVAPWPPDMLDAYYRICASICWYLGHSSLRTIGHKEWAEIQRKWDPGGIDMKQFRARVQYYIDNPPFIPKPEDVPTTEAGEPMEFWNQQISSLVDPKKKFPRRDFLQLTDYHATLANLQSKATLDEMKLVREDNRNILAEMKLVREDLAGLATLITTNTKGLGQ